MFHNRTLMSFARTPSVRLVRQTAKAGKFLSLLFLILTQNVSHINCASATLNGSNSGYASWAAAQPAQAGAVTSVAADTHRLAKRMDLELCLGKFEIHKNTIIRTGESQTLGGKYLQGLELDTAEECQRLCCETESCDVYVFEDKSDGYCYLFECGPPENFHCKFTRHANYTSAVLTVARQMPEVTPTKPSATHTLATNKISQQEWELTSLKVKPEIREKAIDTVAPIGAVEGVASVAPASGNNAIAAEPAIVLGAAKIPELSIAFPQKVSPAHCGRFQFTCHSGECIAVYNACDGIPQCEDGSDEGLECSGATSTAKSNADSVSVQMLAANSQKVPAAIQYQSPLLQQTVQQQVQTVHQANQQQHNLQQSTQQQMFPVVVPPLINNREDAGAWANRKMAAANTPRADQGTVELNSNIFSHKGGIQVPSAGINGNNNPHSLAVNTYMNSNNNNDTPNLNLNPMYNAANFQRNGIYTPSLKDAATGEVYIPPPPPPQQQQQQQFMVPQGHLMLPPNVQWQMQQQQQPTAQQQQPQQTPPAPMQPGSSYVINTADQQAIPTAQTETKLVASGAGAAGPPQLIASHQQNPHQATNQQQIMQQTAVHVALPAAKQSLATVDAAQGTAKTLDGTQMAAVVEEEYADYDEEKSTEPPRKKHKHKKAKAKLDDVLEDVGETSKLDPIELALKQQKQHAPAPSPVHEQYKRIHENLALEFRDHDGQSERPGGAMLSLMLGLLVTAALAILIGCRMRTVGRRTRRMGGKTPYSHEADFLVNGMYL